VVAVSVARVALKTRDDHERSIHPDDPHDIAQNIVTTPFPQRFLEPFREPVVDHRREVLAIETVIASRHQELFGPDQSDGVEQLGADRVVAGFSTIERQQRHTRASPSTQLRQHAAVLVVRMRRRVHREQLLPRACRTPILRQWFRTGNQWRRHEQRDSQARH